MKTETITLYYCEGSSDKIYTASIEGKDSGYIVAFAYGRRGNTLQTGTKTQSAVDYDTAKKLYDKLVREKIAKGYKPGENSVAYQSASQPNDEIPGKKSQGIMPLPQLLNPVGEDQLPALLGNRDIIMQEKFDGRRLLLQKECGIVTGINKLGKATGFPETFAAALRESEHDFLIDGEAVGEDYHAFDLLEWNGEDLRGRTYRERYLHLTNLVTDLNQFGHLEIKLVESVYQPRMKRIRFHELRRGGAEGVVFKQVDARYTAGRPASGGTQFKFKFTETASLIVAYVNARRSVSLLTVEGSGVGNVTIPANREVPEAGEIIEVRYLYAYRGGSLFQPVYLGKRDDVTHEECTIGQLKYKAEPAAAIA